MKDNSEVHTVSIGLLPQRPSGVGSLSYVDLPSLTVTANPEERLSSVLQKAGSKMNASGMAENIGVRDLWCYTCCSTVDETLPHGKWVSRCIAGGIGVDDQGLLVGDGEFGATLTVRELMRAIPAPNTFDADLAVVVWQPDGLGGAGDEAQQLIHFLANHHVLLESVGINILTVAKNTYLGELVKDHRAARKEKKSNDQLAALAQDWNSRRIHRPLMLRQYIHAKDTWIAQDVSHALRIPTSAAEQLLRAVGYEPKNGNLYWSRSDSRQAQRRLKHWLEDEY